MSEERIVRRTLQNSHRGRTGWAAVDLLSEEEIEAKAAADADNPPWTETELASGRVLPAW